LRLRNPVEFAHVALGLVPEILNTVVVIACVCKQLRVVDAGMVKFRHVRYAIAPPAVRMVLPVFSREAFTQFQP